MLRKKRSKPSPIKELKLKQLEEQGLRKKSKKRSRKTLSQKTAQELIRVADKEYSRYVRLRDSEFNGLEWVSECICCGKPLLVIDSEGKWKQGVDNGHFISRGVMSLRYNEFNTNAQSAHCNAWKDKETMLEGYRKGIMDKYGKEILDELKALSKSPDAYKRPTKPELLDIIESSRKWVRFTLDHG